MERKQDNNPTTRSSERIGLLDPKTMDGPSIPYTVNDLFRSSPRLFLTYHAVSTGCHVFNTMGVVLGSALYSVGARVPSRLIGASLMTASTSPFLVMSSTTGLALGSLGMVLGAAAIAGKTMQGENCEPLPMNEEGIQQRVNGLSYNFMVRLLDVSCWSGIGLAATALLITGGPSKLKLCTGTLGVVQALSLGSAIGGVGAFGYLKVMRVNEDNEVDE
jgi:hypothetical protein